MNGWDVYKITRDSGKGNVPLSLAGHAPTQRDVNTLRRMAFYDEGVSKVLVYNEAGNLVSQQGRSK